MSTKQKLKIIQASPPRTGSTLLANLIQGYLAPKEGVNYKTENKIHTYLSTKTHITSVAYWERSYPQYKMFFIMSERHDDKVKALIQSKYKKRPNVLVINYDKLLVNDDNSQEDMINYVFDKLNNFIPKELKPDKDDNTIKDDMEKRVNIVNKTVERLKNEKFGVHDKFTGVHGSHRNR